VGCPAIRLRGRAQLRGSPGPGAGDERISLEKARQLASMLPQLVPTVLGGWRPGGRCVLDGRQGTGDGDAGRISAGRAGQSKPRWADEAGNGDGRPGEGRPLCGYRVECREQSRRRGSRRRRHHAGRRRSDVDAAGGHADDGSATECAFAARRCTAATGFTNYRLVGDDADRDAAGRAGRCRRRRPTPGIPALSKRPGPN
jgi:hypothetical protein